MKKNYMANTYKWAIRGLLVMFVFGGGGNIVGFVGGLIFRQEWAIEVMWYGIGIALLVGMPMAISLALWNIVRIAFSR